jgi:hypothetical protein
MKDPALQARYTQGPVGYRCSAGRGSRPSQELPLPSCTMPSFLLHRVHRGPLLQGGTPYLQVFRVISDRFFPIYAAAADLSGS